MCPARASPTGTCVRHTRRLCGGEGNRTPGLFDATEALYQLSYTPDWKSGRIYLRGLTADPGSPCALSGAALLVRRPAQPYWFADRRSPTGSPTGESWSPWTVRCRRGASSGLARSARRDGAAARRCRTPSPTPLRRRRRRAPTTSSWPRHPQVLRQRTTPAACRCLACESLLASHSPASLSAAATSAPGSACSVHPADEECSPQRVRIDRANRAAGGSDQPTSGLAAVDGTGAPHRVRARRSTQQPRTPRPAVSRITCLVGGPAHKGCHSAAGAPCISAACASPQTSLPALPSAIARSFAQLTSCGEARTSVRGVRLTAVGPRFAPRLLPQREIADDHRAVG